MREQLSSCEMQIDLYRRRERTLDKELQSLEYVEQRRSAVDNLDRRQATGLTEGAEFEDATELKKELGRSIERSNELQRAFTNVVEDKKHLEREYEAAKEELT